MNHATCNYRVLRRLAAGLGLREVAPHSDLQEKV